MTIEKQTVERILKLLESLKARMPSQIPVAEVNTIIEELKKGIGDA